MGAFKDKHCGTCRRKDRNPLIGIWEIDKDGGENMLCMVRIKLFGQAGYTGEAAVKAATDFMQVIGEKYVAGGIPPGTIYPFRDAELAKLGIKVCLTPRDQQGPFFFNDFFVNILKSFIYPPHRTNLLRLDFSS